MEQADIGVIGLATMGQNLALNIDEKGFRVAVFNRTVEKVDAFLQHEAKDSHIIPTHSLPEFVAALKAPRKILLMVKAGAAVDEFIDHLTPLLSAGDIIIDGGNSLFTDSSRRYESLKAKGISFIGAGISGGEEGARHGPSIMPGGDSAAWPAVKPIFQAICAKTEEGDPCCDWVGEQGSGHYVKMVHNGIEYGDMQLICEVYDILHRGLGIDPKELHETFAAWD
jgi:6-phosphogluconate dehydrogenase